MGRQVFTAGEILTAANMNDLSDQAVMVFDDATARTTAIPTPVEGMVTYLKDEDEVTVFDGSAFKAVGPGKILQVVQGTTNTAVSSTSTTMATTTLSASITPQSASSKVLVLINQGSVNKTTGNTQTLVNLQLQRSGTVLVTFGSSIGYTNSNFFGPIMNVSGKFLDSPTTTSAVTYETFFNTNISGQQVQVQNGGTSFITLMEVAG